MKAAVIRTNGEVEVVDREVTLAWLNETLEGYLTSVRVAPDCHGYVNEDGQRLRLPLNLLATAVFHASGGAMSDSILGNMIVLGNGRIPDEDDITEGGLALINSCR